MGSHFETPLLARALGRLFPSRVEKVDVESHFHTPGACTSKGHLHAGVYVELKIFRTLSIII